MAVFVGIVEPFPDVAPDKAQALKPLEEAAEAYGAWQDFESRDRLRDFDSDTGRLLAKWAVDDVMGEIADTIQACCNLAHALGCDDLTPYLAEAEKRNRERGRYEDNGR